jgi:hypothetical protein
VLTTCSEDLLNQIPTTLTAQFQVVNEFEQVFSASMSVTCWTKKALDKVSNTLTYGALGSTTAHLIVRGAQGSLVGLVLDRFDAFGVPVNGREPFRAAARGLSSSVSEPSSTESLRIAARGLSCRGPGGGCEDRTHGNRKRPKQYRALRKAAKLTVRRTEQAHRDDRRHLVHGFVSPAATRDEERSPWHVAGHLRGTARPPLPRWARLAVERARRPWAHRDGPPRAR